jgi:hypothetical protein
MLKNDRGEKLWLNYHVYRNLSKKYGSGSTKAHAAIKSQRCSSIQMESVGHVAAIARTLRRLSAQAALLSRLAAIMHLPFKNLMESGAVSQKMIAPQSWLVAESHSFQPHRNLITLVKRKSPVGNHGGFLISTT